PGSELLHPNLTYPLDLGGCRVALDKLQRYVPVQRREQVQDCRIVGLHRRPELILHISLAPHDSLSVMYQRSKTHQHLRPASNRAIISMLVTESVSKDEGVKSI